MENKRENQVIFGGRSVILRGREIKTGDKAPNFIGIKQDLSEFNFYNETNGKIKIISVVPSIDTGVCSLQTHKFNEEATNLSSDITIITVSVDLPFAQKRYCAAEGIQNIEVISDHRDLDFGNKFGFIIDEFRLLTRGIVIIDKNNDVTYVEYVSEVKNEPNYEKAIEEAKKLI